MNILFFSMNFNRISVLFISFIALVNCATFRKGIDLKFLFIYSLTRVAGSSLYYNKERVKMYHSHFRGTHYEIGFRWGSLLLKHKNIILNNIPFEITKERIDFALSCIPIYKKYFPEILDEIQGIADGQKCSIQILQAILFSMYTMPPACNCSCFAIKNDNRIILGRNSDFLTDVEKLNLNVIYRFNADSYSFTGNTTAFIEMEDGVNEHGLAIGLTSVYPCDKIAGFNAGLLLRYFLEKCKNIQEVISCLRFLPISSAQTFTLADTTGNIAVIECNAKRTEIIHSINKKIPFVCATNIFHHPNMLIYNNRKIEDWFAERRYQTMLNAFSDQSILKDVEFSKKLLSGDYGFLCQYDKATGKDTVWSVIYDLSQGKIYRSEGNPRRKAYKEEKRFQLTPQGDREGCISVV